MGSGTGDATWTCKSCGKQYNPKPPSYNCPSCGSSKTAPNKNSRTMRLFEEIHEAESRAKELEETNTKQQQRESSTTQQLRNHLTGLGMDAKVMSLDDLESVKAYIPDWREDSLFGCVKVNSRNIDLIDVYVAWDKGAQYHIYYDYRIKTDVGFLDNQLRCEWLRHGGRGKKRWRGLAKTSEENWFKRLLFGDKTSENRLSDLLNADIGLTERFEQLLFGLDAPVVDPSRAGYMWIGGFGDLYTDMGGRSNYEHMKPVELVNYGDRQVRVKLRRMFPTLEEFEAYDVVAKYILDVTEDKK